MLFIVNVVHTVTILCTVRNIQAAAHIISLYSLMLQYCMKHSSHCNCNYLQSYKGLQNLINAAHPLKVINNACRHGHETIGDMKSKKCAIS